MMVMATDPKKQAEADLASLREDCDWLIAKCFDLSDETVNFNYFKSKVEELKAKLE